MSSKNFQTPALVQRPYFWNFEDHCFPWKPVIAAQLFTLDFSVLWSSIQYEDIADTF